MAVVATANEGSYVSTLLTNSDNVIVIDDIELALIKKTLLDNGTNESVVTNFAKEIILIAKTLNMSAQDLATQIVEGAIDFDDQIYSQLNSSRNLTSKIGKINLEQNAPLVNELFF